MRSPQSASMQSALGNWHADPVDIVDSMLQSWHVTIAAIQLDR